MPKYRVLADMYGNSKIKVRREYFASYTAKNPQEAIKKAKAFAKKHKMHVQDWKAIRE